ncbi:MAG: ribonuclease D, partial [Pseudonocardiales bacterium]
IYGGPRQRRQLSRWFGALESARALPDERLPTITSSEPGDGIPAASRWRERDPEAAVRLTACRAVVTAVAAEHTVLAQNLLASDVIRRLAWAPPQPTDADTVSARLADLGARPWQVARTAQPLAATLRDTAAAADPSGR